MITVTLTTTEEEMLTELLVAPDTIETTFHKFMTSFVAKFGEQRLQRLANEYRALTPDLQSEALQVLRAWRASKG